jgi:biotin/methionine sulfoxide reductase
LLEPGGSIEFDGRTVTYPDVRLVYWAGGNPFHHHQDLNRLRRAFRKPETIIINEQYWNATARHADIVFPATTSVERNDIGGSSRDPYLLAMHKAIEPVGGARDDYDIFADLARRLGTAGAFTGDRTSDEWVRDCWERTRNKLAERGVVAPDFDGLFEQGYFRVPEPNATHTQFRGFREDPARNRLATPSGRIELFSQAVADRTDPEQPGHPVWNDPEEWLGATLARAYPLHLLTPQPAHRLHGQMEQSSISRAAKRNGFEVLRMNASDAASRGIRQADIVRIFNARGSCVASIDVSEDVARGVVMLPTGAGFQPDGQGHDRNSNPNTLTRDIGTSSLGQGCSAQSCLVEVLPFVA